MSEWIAERIRAERDKHKDNLDGDEWIDIAALKLCMELKEKIDPGATKDG